MRLLDRRELPGFAPYLLPRTRAALERGEIEPTRYESYKRLYEMAKEIKPWELK